MYVFYRHRWQALRCINWWQPFCSNCVGKVWERTFRWCAMLEHIAREQERRESFLMIRTDRALELGWSGHHKLIERKGEMVLGVCRGVLIHVYVSVDELGTEAVSMSKTVQFIWNGAKHTVWSSHEIVQMAQAIARRSVLTIIEFPSSSQIKKVNIERP